MNVIKKTVGQEIPSPCLPICVFRQADGFITFIPSAREPMRQHALASSAVPPFLTAHSPLGAYLPKPEGEVWSMEVPTAT